MLLLINICCNKAPSEVKKLTSTWKIINSEMYYYDSVSNKTIHQNYLGKFIFTDNESNTPTEFLYRDGTWTFDSGPIPLFLKQGDLMWRTEKESGNNNAFGWNLGIAFSRNLIMVDPANSSNAVGYQGKFKVNMITDGKKYQCLGSMKFYKFDSVPLPPPFNWNFELEKE